MSEGAVSVLRSVALDPDPRSVRRARELVTEALVGGGHSELIDTATLLVSELVTNAVLHARTDVGVTVMVMRDGARVEVSDHNPQLPRQRHYDDTATTGRGLVLIEQLADGFGTDLIDGNGKTVWFTLGAATPPPATSAEQPPGRDSGDAATVALLDVPVALFGVWQQHADALLREYMLYCYGEVDQAEEAALQELGIAHQAFSELAAQAGPGVAGAERRVDITVRLASDDGAGFAVLARVLEHAARLAAAGELLVPPSQPELVALRRWVCTEVPAQLLGGEPTPWRHESSADAPPPRERADFDSGEIHRDTRSLIAADDANRILAVSDSAAALLGWSPGELEGRRLIAIIPPRLREAHVAGFVRHLLTGEVRILGRDVPVEALHRDGTEVPVFLHISRVSSPAARAIFVAELRPRESS